MNTIPEYNIVEGLRQHARTLRVKPLPLKDIIPLLQKAADEIEKLRSELAEKKS